MNKTDKNTVRQRITEVLQLVLHGAETADIRQYASENGWGVSDRQLYRYVEEAYKEIAPILDRDRQELLARHYMQRRALFARCMKLNDYKTALQVLKDEAELQGLYPAKKIAPTSPDGTEPYDGGLAAILPELRAAVDRLRQGTGGPHPGEPAEQPA